MKTDKIKKEFVKNLNNIEKHSKKIAKLYGINYIPIITFKEIIKISKPETNTEIESINRVNKSYCSHLDVILETCTNNAKNMNSKNIPIPLISKCILETKIIFKQ